MMVFRTLGIARCVLVCIIHSIVQQISIERFMTLCEVTVELVRNLNVVKGF